MREFNEDREITAWFLLDLSGIGRLRLERRHQARACRASFVAVLARLLTRHGNRVGALLYGTEVDTVLPARGGRRHVLRAAAARCAAPAGRSRRAGAHRPAATLLARAPAPIKRRSMVFVVSDFISAPGWEERARRSSRSATR